MGGQFCPKCGAATGAAAPSVRPERISVPTLSVNGASALCYLFGFITGIVFLVLAPYNRERLVRFHAFQSILLSVAVALLHILISFVAVLMGGVNVALGVAVSALHSVVSLGFFLVWVFMMWKSYMGVKVMLPGIGEIAERQSSSSGPPAGTMGRAA
jgi:uncharacterized membrane protein